MSLYYKWLHELADNPQQWAAFQRLTHTAVIAGPGSGKTHVLAMKIAQLLRDEISPPRGIACLTYTRMMAQELEKRLNLLDIQERPNIFVGTVHGFCLAQVVQPFATIIDLELPKVIRIAPEKTQLACLANAWRYVFKKSDSANPPKALIDSVTKLRRQRADLPFGSWPDHKQEAATIDRYERCLVQQGYVDFDLIVRVALDLIINYQLVRLTLCAKFPWFAVDEYQDLGYPLFRIVTEMIDHTSTRLFAIGDPDQCIFDFAGTDPRYLLALSQRADVQPSIGLKRNYRCTQEIINVSLSILKEEREYYSERVGGRCWLIECPHGTKQQAEVVARLIRSYQQQGVASDHIAVLHRYRDQGVHIVAQVLKQMGVSYVLDKHELYDRTATTIRWLEDLGYWGLTAWGKLDEGCSERHVTFEDLLATWQQFGTSPNLGFSENTNHARIHLASILWQLHDPNQLLRDWLHYVAEALDLQTVFAQYSSIYPDEVEEFYHLLELVDLDKPLHDLTLGIFSHLAPAVQLTTVHSSKGTQFEVVIIAGLECFRANQTDRRLLYVGATRAERELCLLYTPIDDPSLLALPSIPPFVQDVLSVPPENGRHYVTHCTYSASKKLQRKRD